MAQTLSTVVSFVLGTLIGAASMYFAVLPQNYKASKTRTSSPLGMSEEGEDDDETESEDEEVVGGVVKEDHKMILVVRTDLKMTKGKIAAQCSHATIGAYKRALKKTPRSVNVWEGGGQAKVCVKVDSEEELLQVASMANAAGLNNYIVMDAGRTQIKSGSLTVLGIGPAPISAFKGVTDRLKLL